MSELTSDARQILEFNGLFKEKVVEVQGRQKIVS